MGCQDGGAIIATYYVGPGGNDGNSGLTWALRKLTLNGAEDVPIAAGDTVYVGPGVYREMLTCDVSGGVGSEITYIGDVTGENTDDVGGIVRITGSDNDQTAARGSCIDGGVRDYRIFRGFLMDTCTSNVITSADIANWTIEDGVFYGSPARLIHVAGANQADVTIRRCLLFCSKDSYIRFTHVAPIDNSGHLVENCILIGGWGNGVNIDDIGDVVVRNCTIHGFRTRGVDVSDNPNAGHPCIVENCIIVSCNEGVRAAALGGLTEDYNTFYVNGTDRTNVNVGANSQSYTPLFQPPILFSGASQVSGFKFAWWFGALSEWSPVAAITGNNEPDEDFWGIPRPVTASKNSWGAAQFVDMELESTTVQAGSYARVLNDAGTVLVRRVPCTNVQYTVTLYMRYEANYAGNLPRMIIKQPGQADRNTVMTAAANTWEQLSDTFTPAASPGYFEVWGESRNTNGANDKVFYDTFAVS